MSARRNSAFQGRFLTASVAACALALALGPAAARAQDEDDDDDGPAAPIVVQINGPCALTVDGRDTPCRGVAYMAFPSNHRIDFTAITETAGWAFSGEDDENEGGRYALEIDSILNPDAARLDADGECRMQLADDRRTVQSLDCRAMTDQGELTLKASGVIAVDDPDAGDDGDGPDDAPDAG
jgi:hypothetical protein